jgi:hypothetical protein
VSSKPLTFAHLFQCFDVVSHIRYALVSRSKTVLAEFTDQAGNFPTVTRMLLGKVDDSKNGRVSYVYDQYMFHYLVSEYHSNTLTIFFNSLFCLPAIFIFL